MAIMLEDKIYLEKVSQIINDGKIKIEKELEKNKINIKDLNEDVKTYGEKDNVKIINELKIKNNYNQELIKKYEKIKELSFCPFFKKIIVDGELGEETYYIGEEDILDEKRIFKVYNSKTDIQKIYSGENQDVEFEIKETTHFDVKNGRIVSSYKSNTEIKDDILTTALAGKETKATEEVKKIVFRINEENNRIVKNMGDNVLISGVTGSGKLTLALNRVASLLYDNKLDVENFLIITPNDIYSEYIKDKLPNLKSKSIKTITCDDLFNEILSDINVVSSSKDVYEMIYSDKILRTDLNYEEAIKSQKKLDKIKERYILEYKLSDRIFKVIDKYIKHLHNHIPIDDIKYRDLFEITEKELYYYAKTHFGDFKLKNKYIAIFERIKELLNDNVLDDEFIIDTLKEYRKILNFGTKDLYIDLFKNKKDFLRKIATNDKEFDILNNHMLDVVQGNFRFEDTLGYLYFKNKVEEMEIELNTINDSDIKQIIIPGLEDYFSIQIETIKSIFMNANYILLTDVNQKIFNTVNREFITNNLHSICKQFDVLELIDRKESYRLTEGMYSVINKILKSNIKFAKLRKGGGVELIGDSEDLAKRGKHIFKKYFSTQRSTCLIVKSQHEANKYFKQFYKARKQINCLFKNSIIEKKINIVPVYMVKLLEFDQAIMFDWNSLKNKKMIYVSMTRGLKKLDIYYTNKMFKQKE